MTYKNKFRENNRTLRLVELELAKHEVSDHLKQWFARSRLDYLLWYPFRLADFLAGLIFSVIMGTQLGVTAFGVVAAAFIPVIIWPTILMRRLEMTKTPDFERTLRNYIPYSIGRSALYVAVTVTGIFTLPEAYLMPLILLHCVTLRMSATAFTTLVHYGAVNVLIMAAPPVAALLWRGGLTQTLTALIVIVLAGYAISAIYNQYYMFATRRLRTKTMKESNETVQLLLDQFSEQSNDWLWQVDRDGKLVDPPAKLAEAFGIPKAEMNEFTLRQLMEAGPEADRLLAAAAQLQDFQDLPCPFNVNGKQRWISLSGRPQFDRDGAFMGYRGFATDISARRDAEKQVAFLAHYDPLTELPNRNLFNQTLDRVLRHRNEDQLVAVIYVDLDGFKEMNDTYGHEVGDKILCETAERLESIVGPHDMVSRLSGDEFAIMLCDLTDRRQGVHLASTAMRCMDEVISVDGCKVTMAASAGLAFAPQDGVTSDEVLRAADIALYDAKRKGRRNLSMFNQEMQQLLSERRSLEVDLRHAIEEGSLNLYFQPLVEAVSGRICGYEALLRWHHPERGTVSPEKFIGMAEESGLIVPLGEWVIREALNQAAHWPDDVTVAVNLSPTQLGSERLLPTIVNALSQSGVDARRLEIEITESVLLDEGEENLAKLHKLHELGIKVALDDFGTGYSSLNYLRSFPFDKIKIDRCFVQDIVESAENQAIVESVLRLASDLNMVTTAEGVETEQQLRLLVEKGCQQVQGFLYSMAMPASELGYGPIKPKVAVDNMAKLPRARKAMLRPAKPAGDDKPKRQVG